MLWLSLSLCLVRANFGLGMVVNQTLHSLIAEFFEFQADAGFDILPLELEALHSMLQDAAPCMVFILFHR